MTRTLRLRDDHRSLYLRAPESEGDMWCVVLEIGPLHLASAVAYRDRCRISAGSQREWQLWIGGACFGISSREAELIEEMGIGREKP